MKAGSMGEMPPRTRGRLGFSACTASAAALINSPKITQSLSISKSQWDLLFGSFQSITASTTGDSPGVGVGFRGVNGSGPGDERQVIQMPTEVHLGFGVGEDFVAGAAEHRLG